MRSKSARYRSNRKNQSLNGMFSTITPTSAYPSTYEGFPSDQDDWNCGHWKSYYLNNKQIIGQAKALLLIETDTGRIGTWATGQLCNYDCGFIDFFKKEGLSGGSIFSKLYCAGEGAVDAVKNVVDSAEGITGFISGIANSKVLVVGTLLGTYYLYNKYGKKES